MCGHVFLYQDRYLCSSTDQYGSVAPVDVCRMSPSIAHPARGCTATPCSIGTETRPGGQWVRTLDAGKIACAVALAAVPYQQC